MSQHNTIKQPMKLAASKIFFEMYQNKFMFNFSPNFSTRNSYIPVGEVILFIF